MKEYFIKCNMKEIGEFMGKYIQSLSSPIDSFLEEHILNSEFFLITLEERKVGYFSIYKKELLTGFYIEKEYRHLAQKIFFEVKKMQRVRTAFVPTSDEFFMAHAIDSYRNMEIQAYFFQDSERQISEKNRMRDLTLRLAKSEERDIIMKYSGNFFDNIDKSVEKEQIYIAAVKNDIVGFGIIEKGNIQKDYASIGMFTVENRRQCGIGRNILIKLKELVYSENLKPAAGCWYYNHLSKRTLESAGMFSNTRLLKIYY